MSVGKPVKNQTHAGGCCARPSDEAPASKAYQIFPATILDALEGLAPGDHLCCIYETEQQHREVLGPFLRQGLERHEKLFYIADFHTAETILQYLSDDGVDVAAAQSNGQLSVLGPADAYLKESSFDPDRMIELLTEETQRALDEGYSALRVTGEMTWALGGSPGAERLIEYEDKLNEFFPHHRCLAICQYDQRRFDAATLLEVLRTHPIAIIGSEIYDNPYFIPPSELKTSDMAAATLRNWIANLRRRKRTEEQLRESERITKELLDATSEAAFLLDTEGNIIIGNEGLGQRLDRPVAELIGTCAWDYIPEDLAKVRQELMAKAVRSGQPVHFEDHRAGLWLDNVFRPIRDSRGKITKVATFSHDITHRKRLEEALEDKSRVLGDLVKEQSCLLEIAELAENPEASLSTVLQVAVSLLPTAFRYPEVASARLQIDDAIFATANFKPTEWRLAVDVLVNKRTVGQLEVCYLQQRPEHHEGPFLVGEKELLEGLATRLGQIIVHKQHHQESQYRSEVLNAVVEESADAIMLKDVHGVLKYINRAGAALFQREPEEIIGASMVEIFDLKTATRLAEYDRQVVDEGEKLLVQETLPVSNDNVEFSLTLTPRYGDNREVVGIVVVARPTG